MTETAIARELGLTRHEVREIIRGALAQVALAFMALEPQHPIVHITAARLYRLLSSRRRRTKRCSRCGCAGHQKNTCGRRPLDGNENRKARRKPTTTEVVT